MTDEARFQLVDMVQNHGVSVHKASKQLGITYNNAKYIYKIFKRDGRIRQTPRQLKRHCGLLNEDKKAVRKMMCKKKYIKLVSQWKEWVAQD